jgi:hypothetical protein
LGTTPPPHDPTGIAAYLHRLADQLDCYVDLEFAGFAASLEPAAAVAWITAAATHAAATYADRVLRDAVTGLQDIVTGCDPDDISIEVGLLARVIHQRALLHQRIAHAETAFRDATRTLDADLFGRRTSTPHSDHVTAPPPPDAGPAGHAHEQPSHPDTGSPHEA